MYRDKPDRALYLKDIPDVETKIFHLAGLMSGDISGEIIEFIGKKNKLALDVQCMLRCVENGKMVLRDWAEKTKYLPYVTFLKTDAAEAETMTARPKGLKPRKSYTAGGQRKL